MQSHLSMCRPAQGPPILVERSNFKLDSPTTKETAFETFTKQPQDVVAVWAWKKHGTGASGERIGGTSIRMTFKFGVKRSAFIDHPAPCAAEVSRCCVAEKVRVPQLVMILVRGRLEEGMVL